MEIKKIFTAVMTAGAIMTAYSQELNESMTVQGAYDPVIRHHERLSGLPSRPELPAPQASLETDARGVPVSVNPDFSSFSAMAYAATLDPSYRGYLDLSAGSYLNSTLSAGYRILADRDNSLGVWLQHTSTSLYRPNELSPYRRRYDETLGTDYFRNFGVGCLTVGATYHLGYFNYYRVLTPWGHEPQESPSNVAMPGYQTLNDISLKASWRSAAVSRGVFYGADAIYRYFGYRCLYEWASPEHNDYTGLRPARENDIRFNLFAGYALSPSSRFALTLKGEWLTYANSPLSTAGFYTLTPSYTLSAGSLQIRAALNLDFTSGIEGYHKFSSFHAAPDVALTYAASHFSATLEARGGVRPNTLSSLHELAYYSCPTLTSTTPVFAPIDMTLRLGFGNYRGFNASVFASYASVRNTPLAGTYPLYLFHQLATPESFILHPAYLNIHGFSLGADMKYAMGAWLAVEGRLTYSPQHGDRGMFNGIDRPRWTLTTEATVSPITPLTIGVGYEYRGVRHLYYRSAPGMPLASLRLPDLYNLHARADYTFAGRYTIGFSVDNILSSHAWLTPAMPVEGLVLSGRFSLLF